MLQSELISYNKIIYWSQEHYILYSLVGRRGYRTSPGNILLIGVTISGKR